jgi:hypothetical protein
VHCPSSLRKKQVFGLRSDAGWLAIGKTVCGTRVRNGTGFCAADGFIVSHYAFSQVSLSLSVDSLSVRFVSNASLLFFSGLTRLLYLLHALLGIEIGRVASCCG